MSRLTACLRKELMPTQKRLLFIQSIFCCVATLQLQTPGLCGESDWQLHMVEGKRQLEKQNFQCAEDSFKIALRRLKRAKAQPDQICLCLQGLGNALLKQDKVEQALPVYKRALHLLRQTQKRSTSCLVPILTALGDIYEADGDYRHAVNAFSEALSIIKTDPGEKSLSLADCQHRLARAEFKAGRSEKAEELYQSCLTTIMLQSDLPSSDLLESVLTDYIDFFQKTAEQGRVSSSNFQKELLNDNLGRQGKSEGVDRSAWQKEVSAKMAYRANTEASQPLSTTESARPLQLLYAPATELANPSASLAPLDGINRQRIEFYERMIATDIESLGGDHPSVARDLSGLASVYLSQKKYDKAKPLLERALEIYSTTYGADALLAKRTQALITLISQEEPGSNSDSSNSGAEYAIALPSIPLAARKLEIALKLNDLAFLCFSYGRVANAEYMYALALANTNLTCGSESALAACCLSDYGRVLRERGKLEDAQKAEKKASSILRTALFRQATLSLP